jgi:hypothetical protein
MTSLKVLRDKDTTTVGNSCGPIHIPGAGTWDINSTQNTAEIAGKDILIDGNTATAGDGCVLVLDAISQGFVEIDGDMVGTDADKCENLCHPDDTTASQTFVVIEV